MVAIAAPGHRLARAPVPLDTAALADEPFIVREPGSGTREVVWAALTGHGIRPRATLEVGSTETVKQVVAAGLGVAVVSEAAAADQLALGTLVELEVRGFAVGRTLTRLSLPDRRPSAAAAAFDALLDRPA